MNFTSWVDRLKSNSLPAYLQIPDLIAEDLQDGQLGPHYRLPPLRALADQLELNYSTVVRGIAEARRRGLVDSRPGMGTYVRGTSIGLPLRAGAGVEMMMNQPPEIEDHPVMEALRSSAAKTLATTPLHDLLRYQDFGGNDHDRAVAAQWLRQWIPEVTVDRVLVAPGIQAVLLALMTMLVKLNQSLCVECLSYPGIKAIAAQLGTRLLPLPLDESGVDPESFEFACKSTSVAALYLCPNLHNPTTATLPIERREQLAEIALRYSIPIIEDDAYGMLPRATPPALADFAPALTYYVSGLSKWLGAGLRTAYVIAPDEAAKQRLSDALRATTVMASPFVNAMVSNWFEQGHAAVILDAVREECAFRSSLVRERLASLGVRTHPACFHAWLPMPAARVGCATTTDMAAHLRRLGVPAVAGSVFSTDRKSPEGMRLCMGGALTRDDCGRALQAVRDTVAARPA